MEETTGILVDLFLIFALAKLAGEIFVRLGQPAMVGEVLVGVAIGPHAIGLIGQPEGSLIDFFGGDEQAAKEALEIVYDVIAELGVIILLFFVGLETRLQDLVRVGARASVVGLLGIIFPFVLGFGLIWLTGRSNLESAFVATAMVATSVGITARVLGDMGVIRSREARIILGAAVVDDILGLLLLSIVKGFSEENFDAVEVGFSAIAALAFVAFAALVGRHVIQRYSIHADRLRTTNGPLLVAIVIMLGLSAAAGLIGLAAIIGAFLAGMMLAEAQERFNLEHQTRPIYEFLTPFFFVVIGTKVEVDVFQNMEIVAISLGVTALAILGKVAGGLIALIDDKRRSALIVGIGMAPRGEVGLVIASVGSGIGAISNDMFSAVVFMSIATTLVAPPMLIALIRGKSGTTEAGIAVAEE
ncbi:MAG TPA: cation:proton antiporter [Dehalococcoidia bacterium]|nr:cation:proton antiporter [Dehalococcoidia bacterium]